MDEVAAQGCVFELQRMSFEPPCVGPELARGRFEWRGLACAAEATSKLGPYIFLFS